MSDPLAFCRSIFLVVVLTLWGGMAAAAQPEIETDTIPGTEVAFSMAFVPGGTFAMGSVSGRADERPVHAVRVAPFWMGVHEVTYDEFAIFRYVERDNPAPEGTFDPEIVARPSPPYEDPSHGMGNQGFPVVGITQWAALQYARWLSAKTGRFYRLPTEAEWEFACRAGAETEYGFGSEPEGLDAVAWYFDNGDEVTHPVGLKDPNGFGIHDLHGNVAEWTLDQYDEGFYATFDGDAVLDPWAQPTRLHPRTVKGGAYDDDADALRCAARQESSHTWKRRDPQIPKSMWWNTDSQFVGFRLVRPHAEPPPVEQAAFWSLVLGE